MGIRVLCASPWGRQWFEMVAKSTGLEIYLRGPMGDDSVAATNLAIVVNAVCIGR